MPSPVALVELRARGALPPAASRRSLHDVFAPRLRLAATLEAHRGCVNRLCWNDAGTLLLSGSDDRHLLLWRNPASSGVVGAAPARPCAALDSQHDGNVFGVRFLPATSDGIIGSCAADGVVRAHDVAAQRCVAAFRCHDDRVKAVDVAPADPHSLFSASEDGTVRHFDLRQRGGGDGACGGGCCSASQLVVLRPMRGTAQSRAPPLEAKSVAVNPMAPHLLAVGAGDSFVRVFDRRALSSNASAAAAPLHALAPPHLARGAAAAPGACHVTHATWDAAGARLLASYHGDQTYMFDLRSCDTTSSAPRRFAAATSRSDAISAASSPRAALVASREDAEAGTAALRAHDARAAVRRLSRAIAAGAAQWSAKELAALHAARASALLTRGWKGDAGAALTDAADAAELDADSAAAALRRAGALRALGRLTAAERAAQAACAAARQDSEDNMSDAQQLLTDVRAALRERQERRAAAAAGRNVDGATAASTPASGWDTDDDENDASFSGAGGASSAQWARTAAGAGVARCMRHFCGAVNVATDIKECAFMGAGGRESYVAAGSDDGRVFIWDAGSGEAVAALRADADVANCVAPHPHDCTLATSGLEHVIRLWEPGAAPEDATHAPLHAAELDDAAATNQARLPRGTRAMGARITSELLLAMVEDPATSAMLRALLRGEEALAEPEGANVVACRTQ